MKITEGVYRIQTSYANLDNIPLSGYLIVGRSGIAMIDAMIPRCVRDDVPQVLGRIGLKPSDIDMVIVTHGHPDHAGGLAELRAANEDIEVFCSPAERAWVEDQSRMFDELFLRYTGVFEQPEDVRAFILKEMCGSPTRVTGTIKPGDVLDLGGTTLRIIDASGHTPGHIAVLDERSQSVFTGDAVQGSGIPFVNGPHATPPLYEDVETYVATQRRLKSEKPRFLLSAHNAPISDAGVADFLDYSVAIVERGEEFARRILAESKAPVTLAELARGLRLRYEAADAEDYVGPMQFHLDAAAHLRSLSRLGQAREVEPDNWIGMR